MSKRRGINWPLILGFLAVGGIALFAFGKKLTSQIYVKKVSAQDIKLTWTGITGKIILEIQNNSEFAATITGFIGKVLYGEFPVADLNIASPITIQTGTSTIVPINITVGYEQLPESIINIVQSGQYLSALKVKGNLYGQGITLPIDYTIRLTP